MKTTIFPTPNGLSLCCDEKQVVAVTDQTGQKKLKSFKTKNKIIFWHFPFVRGLQYFFCGLFMFFQSLILSFDLSGKAVKVKDLKRYYIKKIAFIVICVVLGVLIAELLLGFVPNQVGYLLVDYKGDVGLRNLIMALCKVVVLYLAVLLQGFCQGCWIC